ncbi:hypothetical protein FF100_22075 [Methylobacterium terricola]|uniref:Uncharacterized protein n=1 Tax=Methylobacterium terricola TaxID=2583531 RepID=A0A5C4LDM6_9HYPH|nr:hypothetical protein [Methylobacterium terricola]TNC10841.1 hypothetical protein FF100_22075 [Methylobacterium terricola]
MDILSGPGLVEAIAEEINREDLSATIPAWIRMAEAHIAQNLRVREMVRRQHITASDGFVTLPTDFREMKSVRIDTGSGRPRTLFMATEDSISDPRKAGTWANHPMYFTIVGSEIELSPFPNGFTCDVQMTYFADLPVLDLVTANSTTWLLKKAPHLYFYAALQHSAPYIMEDARLMMWQQLTQDAIGSLNKEYDESIHSGSTPIAPMKTIG